jgi:hypothetical protein
MVISHVARQYITSRICPTTGLAFVWPFTRMGTLVTPQMLDLGENPRTFFAFPRHRIVIFHIVTVFGLT